MSDVVSQGVAVITGAAGGIGFALAREAVGRGMPVVISDVREDALEEARERLVAANGNVLARLADVTDSGQVEALAEAAVERFGKVNLLINNAGAFVGGLAWETPEDQFGWVIELNLKSVARGIRAFVPRMIAQGNPDTTMAPGELARRVFSAVEAGELYCLPNHDSDALIGVGSAIGRGRATGVNPWEPILESILNSMSAADERPA